MPDRAAAIADVAQVIVNSAKVEVDHLRALDALGVKVDGTGTGFILPAPPALKVIK